MNVVDSSAWIEYFVGGSNAAAFSGPISDTQNLLVPSICVYEVFKRLLQARGEDEALRAVGFMLLGLEADINRTIAIEAARISLELKLAMADSLIYATTLAHHATLWTMDEHFKGLPGVQYREKTRPV